MNSIILKLIIILHLIFVLFVILVPFIGSNYTLLIHIIIVPVMILHWYTNDNNCALTVMEKKIRKNIYGYDPKPVECFTFNIISPVYDFTKTNYDMAGIIYFVTICLWLFSVYKFYSNYKNGKMNTIRDFLSN